MALTPDLTKMAVLIPNKDNNSDSPNSSNSSGCSEKTARDSMISTQRLLPCLGTTDFGQLTLGRNVSGPSDCKPNNRPATISCQLPTNIDLNALVWTMVGHEGGRLTLPDSGKFKLFLTEVFVRHFSSTEQELKEVKNHLL